MTKAQMIAGGLAIAALVIVSNIVTYKVDEHFDYVRSLERTVEEQGIDLDELEGENLGLKSIVQEPAK